MEDRGKDGKMEDGEMGNANEVLQGRGRVSLCLAHVQEIWLVQDKTDGESGG